jgi:hypothetical protein
MIYIIICTYVYIECSNICRKGKEEEMGPAPRMSGMMLQSRVV